MQSQISPEHLAELRKITDAKEQITIELGRNQTVQLRAKLEKEQLEANFLEILKKENEMTIMINKIHGNVNINLQDGTIITQK